MDVRKVQDVRKNVEHQYITEDSKTRIYLSVVREFNEKEYEKYSKKKKRAKIKKRTRIRMDSNPAHVGVDIRIDQIRCRRCILKAPDA